jgi:hypothetical protein
MTTLTIELSDERMQQLVERAEALGMTPEEWVRFGITERLAQPPSDEERARAIAAITAALFEERADVYKALAEGAR